MNKENGKLSELATEFITTVKVRKSGGRNLELTIPIEAENKLGWEDGDELIVFIDNLNQSYIMFVNPKNTEGMELNENFFLKINSLFNKDV